MDIVHLHPDDRHYPPALQQYLGGRAPDGLAALGDLAILRRKALAFFCSVKCPGDLILQTYDLARRLREAKVTVIGGFHSPMEKECLMILLRGTQPVIICPARGLEGMRLPAEWQLPLSEGRLLLLSPFGPKYRRVTADLARKRNEFVAAVADRVFVAHAGAGSKTEQFCREALDRGKPLFILESSGHSSLIAAGARPLRPDAIHGQLMN